MDQRFCSTATRQTGTWLVVPYEASQDRTCTPHALLAVGYQSHSLRGVRFEFPLLDRRGLGLWQKRRYVVSEADSREAVQRSPGPLETFTLKTQPPRREEAGTTQSLTKLPADSQGQPPDTRGGEPQEDSTPAPDVTAAPRETSSPGKNHPDEPIHPRTRRSLDEMTLANGLSVYFPPNS